MNVPFWEHPLSMWDDVNRVGLRYVTSTLWEYVTSTISTLWKYVTSKISILWKYVTSALWKYVTSALWKYVTSTLWKYVTSTLWNLLSPSVEIWCHSFLRKAFWEHSEISNLIFLGISCLAEEWNTEFTDKSLFCSDVYIRLPIGLVLYNVLISSYIYPKTFLLEWRNFFWMFYLF